jgi:hypothetical protein
MGLTASDTGIMDSSITAASARAANFFIFMVFPPCLW